MHLKTSDIEMSSKKIIVIGSGFSGLSVATSLADSGHQVTIIEKNENPGGRARKFETSGFLFDMGPSWYWMPDVFDQYFAKFGKKVSDYYELVRLDPSYCVWFGQDDKIDLPASKAELFALFEQYEPGSSKNLDKFLKESEYKYQVGINNLVYKPSRSIFEFTDPKLLLGLVKMQVFTSMRSYIRGYFKHPKLIQILEFPVIFLGAMSDKIPALYSLMNYADMELGTWYPKGGMHKIIEGMISLAEEKGVKLQYGSAITKIQVENGVARGVVVNGELMEADVVVSSADYHHTDKHLLDDAYSNYTEKYWDSRVMAPSSLLYYLGVNKRIDGLLHHNLFFDSDFEQHSAEIYVEPKWPTDPLFYVSCPSKTDPTVAPEGMENIFLLVPAAPDLADNQFIKDKYFNMIMDRLEKRIGQDIRSHIVYRRDFAHSDFQKDYNAYKGNAYGLANTLLQTAILKPSLKNKKVSNLFYTGQLTVPGPGVPPSLISGLVVADQVNKEFKR
ncbi:MAG: phytoene desaturase family protein [Luteibaculaceae bacterium]